MRSKLIGYYAVAFVALTTHAKAEPLGDRDTVLIGGREYKVQSSNRPEAIQRVGRDGWRFTLRPGEQWVHESNRGQSVERAELSSKTGVYPGDTSWARFSVKIDGADLEPLDGWMVVTQLHGPNRSELPKGSPLGPPPFAVVAHNDTLRLVVRSGDERTEHLESRTIAAIPFEPGRWYDLAVRIRLGDDASGRVTVWLEDGLLADWRGAVGYRVGSSRHYWKFGLYQSAGSAGDRHVEFANYALGVDPS